LTKFAELKCEAPGCGRGVATGHTLHRVNPTGQTGVWRCRDHLSHAQAADIDSVTIILEREAARSPRAGMEARVIAEQDREHGEEP
jgi:hypothetical protein